MDGVGSFVLLDYSLQVVASEAALRALQLRMPKAVTVK